jgi:hypothetical protein
MLLLIIALFVTIIGIILAGVKLADKIDDMEVKLFFWVLYGVSILTLFLVSVCVYIYISFRKKSGPLGPRGFQGNPGGQGDEGSCDQNLCRARTLAVLMEKIIEEFNQEGVNRDIRNNLCGYVTHEDHPNKLKKWNLMDVKIFRDVFTQQVNMEEGKITHANIQNVLKKTSNKFNGKYDDATKKLDHDPSSGTYDLCTQEAETA